MCNNLFGIFLFSKPFHSRLCFLYLLYLLGNAFGGVVFAQRFGSCEFLLSLARKTELQLDFVLWLVNILDTAGRTVAEKICKILAVKSDFGNLGSELVLPRLALQLHIMLKVGNTFRFRLNNRNAVFLA